MKISSPFLLVIVALALVGCPMQYADIGYNDHEGASAVAGTGGAGPVTTSGGSGGLGGACLPQATAHCYDGPKGTEGVGICKGGLSTCGADGKYGPCEGQVTPKIEDCAAAIDANCDGLVPACKGNLLWSERFGNPADQYAQRIAVDSTGCVFVTGCFVGAIDFGGGPLPSLVNFSPFVAKLNANGGYVWSKGFVPSGGGGARGAGIAVDSTGNVLATGSFSGTIDFGGGPLVSAGAFDIYVAKFDAVGKYLWSRRFGDAGEQDATSVAVDSAGNIIVVGKLTGSVDFGGGPLPDVGGMGVFAVKLDADGNHKWSRRFGDASEQEAEMVAVDSADHIFITGLFYGSVDFGGGPLASAGGADIFVAKLDTDGKHLWSKRFGNANEQSGNAIAVDSQGNVVLAGELAGSVDFGGGPLTSAGSGDIFVAKLDVAGKHLWSKRFGDAEYQTGFDVATDKNGNIVLTGQMIGSADFGGGPLASAGGTDVFLAKLDAGGGHLWSKRFGDASPQYGSAVATDPAGNVLVAGGMTGTADFGGGPLVSAGGVDVFIAKFAP